MKLIPLLFLLIHSGCSKESWLAHYYMVQAENAASEAYGLRVKKGIPYEERLRYYRKACQNFSKAYEVSRKVFTLSRIEMAAESCLRINDRESEEKFRAFEEEYVEEHPTETEYGDAGVFLGLE